MSSYNSNPFNLKFGAQEVPGGLVFSGGRLVYGYRKGGHLCYITCTPPSGLDPWTNVSPATSGWQSNWSRVDTGINMTAGLSMPAVSFPNPTTGTEDAYILTGNSYIFQISGQNNAVTAFQLASKSGSTNLTAVGATAWGNYLLVGWWNTANNVNSMMWEAYDTTQLPSPIPANYVFQPSSEVGGYPQQFQIPGGGFLPSDVFGPVASMDWYSQGGNDFYLVTSFMNNTGGGPYVLVTPVGSGPLPTPQIVEGPTPYVFQTMLIQGFPSGTGQVMVARDASGRMTLSTCYQNNQLMLTMSTDSDAATAWNNVTDLSQWTAIATGVKAGQSAVPTWAVGQEYSYTYPNNGPTTNRQDIYQVSIFGDSGSTIMCEIQSFGIAEQVPNAVSGQLLPSGPPYTANNTTYTGVVAGIFDAPFPMPASNIQSNNLAPGYVLGDVTYGVTTGDSHSYEADFSAGGGFSSTGSVSVGTGPAWNISVQAGTTIDSGGSTYSGTMNNSPLQTRVDNTGQNVVPWGAVEASNVVYTGDCYRVLDVNGNPLPNCGVICTIVPTLSPAEAMSFMPYLVTPGDITSYTKEKVNAQASQLGLLQSGETDYVADVIQKNALSFSQNQNYLLWNQTQNSGNVPGYLSSTDEWQETGWYMDSSIYVGFSYGASLSLLGETVAAFSVEDLAGVNLSVSHSATTEQSTQLQIDIDNMQMPIAMVGSDIATMTVQIYFLPANARWMQELAKCSGLTLTDTNSSPWRIFFLVTAYTSLDGQTKYPPPPPSDGPIVL